MQLYEMQSRFGLGGIRDCEGWRGRDWDVIREDGDGWCGGGWWRDKGVDVVGVGFETYFYFILRDLIVLDYGKILNFFYKNIFL